MIDIQLLADKKGIAREYLDATNKLVKISDESRKNVLEILGYPVEDEKALQLILDKEELEPFKNVLDPVQVINDEDLKQFYIRTPESFGEDENATLSVSLKLEDGRVIERELPLEQVEIADFKNVAGTVYDVRRYSLISDLPYGYHECSVVVKANGKTLKSIPMSLIITPVKMYTPESILNGKKVWGVSSQLYSVRSRNNWGIGDFADLKQLLLGVHKCGGQFVGLNPMHAGYPAIPDESSISPYSPSSRNWVNIVYISVNSVPELAHCKEALDLINSEKFQQKLRVLRDKEYVDYRGVIEAKLQVLRMIFDNVKVDDKRSSRGNKFNEFVERGGENLINFATYDAMQQYFYSQGVDAYSWEKFPKEYQDIHSTFVESWRKDHQQDVMF